MNVGIHVGKGISESMEYEVIGVVMDERQRRILNWLREVEVEFGELYEGALRMMKDRSFPGRERLICHAVREIRNRLPNAVAGKHAVGHMHYTVDVENLAEAWKKAGLEGAYERQNGKTGNELEQHVPREVLVLTDNLVRSHKEVRNRKEENAIRLLIALEPENEQLRGSLRPVVRKWIKVTEWFVERAHMGKIVSEEELVAQFESFETVLVSLVGYFYEGLEEIKKFVEKTNASGAKSSESEVVAVVQQLGRPKYRMYFFDKLENLHWIEPLRDAGFFKIPQDAKEGEAYERWPEGWYLKKVSSKVPEEVLGIISGVSCRNPYIRNTCSECLLEMPVGVAANGGKIVENILPRGRKEGNLEWAWVGQPCAKLMVKLREKYTKEGFEIAWVLLDAWVPKDKKLFEDIVAKFSDHDYRELVLKHYAELWKVEPERAFWVLVKILDRCLQELDKENGYDVSSHYYVGQGLRDLNSIDVGYGGIKTVLVKGMCETGRVLIEKGPNRVSELMDGLEKLNRAIFTRIEMYLLRFVGSGIERDRINKIIRDMKYLEEPGYKYEYKLLLRDKFDEVQDARQVFEQWVQGQKIDDMEDWEEWFRRVHETEPNDEDKARYVAGMKARQLFLVKDRYPSEYEKYKTESGLSDAELAPRQMVSEARHVSAMEGTPLSPEEMADMKIDDILNYVLEPKNYEGKMKPGEWREPADALRATLQGDVKKRPIEYLKEGREKLANLPAGFLSGFFYGISEVVREGSFGKEGWGDLIELAHKVVQGKQKEEEYRNCFSAMLSTLREGFSGRENNIEFDKERVRKFWEIIEPLVHFPIGDRSGLGEERDPVQLSCNEVAGQSMELSVPLGVVCKKEQAEYYNKQLKKKMRKCWEYVLSEIKQPGVNCMYGLDFARIYWLDSEWVEESLDKIFSDELWDETWGTYVSWGRPSTNGFKLLVKRGKYELAVNKLGQANKFPFQKNQEEGLVEHLMIGVFNGWIGFDDDVLKVLFEKGSAKLRGKAANFLTTGFKSVNEEGGKERENVAKRMREYWENRLEVMGKNPKDNIDEAIEFTGWGEDTLLDAKTTLVLLERTLDLTGGKLSRMRGAHELLEGVLALGKGNELSALRCLKKAVVDENMQMMLSLHEERLVGFLERIAQLEDESIRREAAEVADVYGRIQPEMFRGVWGKLRNKGIPQ